MLLKTESYKKGIVLSTFFNILNKGLVFVNSLVVAFYFGAQLKTDIYFYAYNTIVILSAFITSLNASVLIPESMRIRAKNGNERATEFLNFFIFSYALITVLLCIILILDPVSSFRVVSDFDLKALQDHRSILLLATPLVLLVPLVNLLTDIMTSFKFFTMPMYAGIINGIFSIGFVVLFHDSLDVLSLLTGLLFSYTINFILLIILMHRKLAWKFQLKWIKIEKRIWKNIGFAQAGNITTSISSYLPLYLLSGFNGGIITALTYAQQVSSMPTTLITNQFSAVAGIKFNELTAEGNLERLNELFLDISDFLLFVLLPISGIVFLFSDEICFILFNRGAFDKLSVMQISLFLRYLILLLPMLAINTLIARLFMAAHLIKQAFWYQITLNTLFILFIYVGIKSFEIQGYFFALLTVYILSTLLQYFMLKKILPYINYKLVLKKFTTILLINIAIFFVTFYAKQSFSKQLNYYVVIAAGSAIYLSLMLVFNHFFKINKAIAQGFKKPSFI